MEKKEREKIKNQAFYMAQKAFLADEVPVGAVIFNSLTGEIIAKAHNQTEQKKDVLAHAEMLAIRQATRKLKCKFLDGYSMYVTLEPCVMCAGAASWTRLDAVFYGASDPKTGAIRQGAKVFTRSQTHHKPKSQLVSCPECGQIMSRFFKEKRSGKKV
ncbi:MAG: nucleoside deaminase [Alphaproteobacteria bacterium]|nr:nucleoside deaminase [Alphaproteobacteria bacterium]